RLWEEISAQGYTGSAASVYRVLTQLLDRKNSSRDQPAPLSVRAWSTRKISLLMCKQSPKLNEEESKYLQTLYTFCPEAKKAGMLALNFKDIMDNLNGNKLDKWMQKVEESKISSLVNFVKGLKQDYHAVKAGLTLQWSNGQVEGQVNRLKNIKRRMYGKASFCLLRKCVLSDTS
ncbi:MAG: transposase, partial [Nitrosopumilus sp.]